MPESVIAIPDAVRPATYKLELHFGSGRTTQDAKGAFTCWESGKALNGDGDVQMVFCGFGQDTTRACERPFSVDCIQEIWAVCPHCNRKQWANVLDKKKYRKRAEFRDQDLPCCHNIIVFPTNSTRWISERLVYYFDVLMSDADVYLKYHPKDIRYTTMVEHQGAHAARKMRGLHIYPLANIIKDTSTGASLAGRFLAFIRA